MKIGMKKHLEIISKGRFGHFKVSKRQIRGFNTQKYSLFLPLKCQTLILDTPLGSLVRLSWDEAAYGRDLETVFTTEYNLKTLTNGRKQNILRQATIGLKYLHQQNIVHQNINPKNILISSPNSKGVEVVKLMSQSGVNESYLSPETQISNTHDQKSDIFALGCIFHFVIHQGKHPFQQNSENIIDGNAVGLEIEGNSFLLIDQMIKHDPRARCGLNSILSHYYFWSPKKCLFFLKAANRACKIMTQTDEEKNRLSDLNAFHSISISHKDWRRVIPESVYRNKSRKVSFQNTTRDLLRAISYSTEISEKSNKTNTLLWTVWSAQFPCLLPFVYGIMKNFEYKKIKKFYKNNRTLPAFHDAILGR